MTLGLQPQPILPPAEPTSQRQVPDPAGGQSIGEYTHAVIAQQYGHMIDQEAGVLADQDPEYLHQMRVGSRRLRTALRVFGPVVKLPKRARVKQIRAIAQALGQLRDLDVQIASIEADYSQRVQGKVEKRVLQQALKKLKEKRVLVFAEVRTILVSPSYRQIKQAYEKWLRSPRFNPIGDLPLLLVLPDLLNPLIASLLLHPGWLVGDRETSTTSRQTLHNLRKLCKYVRYQAEFFSQFYGQPFHAWIQELKTWQDNLGTVQDIYVFRDLLVNQTDRPEVLPAELHQATETNRHRALQGWEDLRQRYLSRDFRQALYTLILHPQASGGAWESSGSHPGQGTG